MKRAGFTLIELMIVIAIISIISAIAIPNLLTSRRAANEASAIAALRAIVVAEAAYQGQAAEPHATSGVGQYGDLNELASAFPPFVDDTLGAGAKSGYAFTVAAIDDPLAPTFDANADPASYPRSGLRSFYSDETGAIWFRTDGAQADANSTPLQN